MAGIIAIDPGTRLCGYAVFWLGRPRRVGVVKSSWRTVEARAAHMAHQILDDSDPAFETVIVERPVIYPDSEERDSDIVDLAVTAGVLAGSLFEWANELVMPTPREWKGTTPKHIHNARTEAKCPAAAELMNKIPKGQRNHVWDAVGLALWQLERTR